MNIGSIALCMIVRNEADRLRRCLSSVQGLVQEMWVVDTGSTDDTVSIAQEMGANVITFPWCDDFSAARNVGLAKANAEWILVLDADEAVAAEDVPALKMLLSDCESKSVGAYVFPISSFIGENAGAAQEICYNIRLFRNKPQHRYEGAVHEQILPSIQRASPQLEVKTVPVKVLHYGYLNTLVKAKKKVERNFEIISNLLKENPQDFHLHYHAGVCLYNLGRHDEAVLYLTQVLEHASPTLNYVARALKILVLVLKQQGKTEQALAALNKYQRHWPQYTDLLYLRAQLYYENGNLSRALDAGLTCIAQGPAPPPYDSHAGVSTYGAAALVGDIAKDLGNMSLAETAYSRVPVENPDLVKVTVAWLTLLSQRLGENAALMELTRRMPRPYDYELLAEICAGANLNSAALRLVSSASGMSIYKKRLFQGRLLYQSGRLNEALECFCHVPPQSPEWPQACLWRAYCTLAIEVPVEDSVDLEWADLHADNRSLLDLINYLRGGNAKKHLVPELLLPLLRAVAPNALPVVLQRAVDVALSYDWSLIIPLARTIYSHYHNLSLAYSVYDQRAPHSSDPWLEARLFAYKGLPLHALRASLQVLKSPRPMPEDYIQALRASLALRQLGHKTGGE